MKFEIKPVGLTQIPSTPYAQEHSNVKPGACSVHRFAPIQGQVARPVAEVPRAPTESEARTIARIMAASVTSEALRFGLQSSSMLRTRVSALKGLEPKNVN